MKKSNVLAGLALLAVTATVSAGQLPHTGPGQRPKQPPAPCNFQARCAPADAQRRRPRRRVADG